MKLSLLELCCLGSLASACLPPIELTPTGSNAGTGGGPTGSAGTTGSAGNFAGNAGSSGGALAGVVTCGGAGQSCCVAPALPCNAELSCDDASNLCEAPAARLCTADGDCPARQTCCPSGLLGTCLSVEPAECPGLDLAVVTQNAQQLRAWFDEQRVDPLRADSEEQRVASACALEQGCVRGSGLRRLLRFSTRVSNVGGSDLLLGSPALTPGFTEASCNGERAVAGFLSYQLRDEQRNVVSESGRRARCQPDPNGFRSRFDCEFQGIARGFAQPYDPQASLASDGGLDCQWLDVTDLPGGNYQLRISVNPQRLLQETDYTNNTVELPITLPDFNPLHACTTPAGTNEPGLYADCGWSLGSSPSGVRCTPGEPISVACPDCSGDPMLRVCGGPAACSARDALTTGLDTLRAEPDAGADCDPNLSSCVVVSECPVARFTCPPSGSYGWLLGVQSGAEPVACNLLEQLP